MIVGDGPLRAAVEAAADVAIRGSACHGELLERATPNESSARRACLLMPSLWYETFGRTIAEAYAAGTPVAVSRLGAMAELVERRAWQARLLAQAMRLTWLSRRRRTQLGGLPTKQASAMRRCRGIAYEQTVHAPPTITTASSRSTSIALVKRAPAATLDRAPSLRVPQPAPAEHEPLKHQALPLG